MASSADESVVEELAVRRTRSGRAVKAPPTPTAKPTTRKTKKKTILVEVEVSEDDEDQQIAEKDQNDDEKPTEELEDSEKPTEEDETNNKNEQEIICKENLKEENHVHTIEDTEVVENKDEIVDKDEVIKKEDNTGINENKNEIVNNEIKMETIENIENGDILETNENDKIQDIKENDTETKESLPIKEKEIESIKLEENHEKETESIKSEEIQEKETESIKSEEIQEKETESIKSEEITDEIEAKNEVRAEEEPMETDSDAKVENSESLNKEVVSEDELPTVKKDAGVKRKIESAEYDPGSPTSENDVSAAKRQAVEHVEAEVEKAPVENTTEKEKEKEKEKNVEKDSKSAVKDSKSKLPELDKYWKAVNDDPSDFTGWTYLLQYVDQVNDIEAAREAYDAFLSHYPYCYGYWRKYADYEKRKGNKKKCEEVFERGLKAIPLSVDLWLHFLNYTKTAYADSEDHIREQFERALTACGLEFRSDRLWDTYIKWETEGKRLQNVTAIYDRLLVTPTQGYTTHFDNFQEHVSSHAPNKILSVDEFLQIRKEVRQLLKHEGETPSTEDSDIPPGEDDTNDETIKSDEETKALKEKIVSIRRKLHKVTVAAVTARWNFEEGIKRPYFHVKPLERCQLKNWKEYLDYEIEQGDRQRIMVLFERCLIACALYEEFWLRYVRYLEEQKDESLHAKIREIYERACTVHHVGKPALHLAWAIYEEAMANLTKASEILINLEKSVPNLLQVAYRRINLERRRGDFEKCSQLYEYYINNSKNKSISSNMAIKYARFSFKICHDSKKAVEILNTAITKDPSNPRLHLQLIDLCLQKEEINEKEILDIINQYLEKDANDSDQKVLFAQRKLEFLEDFGSDIQAVQQAYEEYQKYCKINKEKKKKEEAKLDPNAAKKLKPDSQAAVPSTASGTYGGYGNYGSGASQNPNNYSQYSGQQSGYGGQYGGQYPQGGGDQYQYQNWQYSQTGYGGYNQWGSYGNYYQ
ncbi:pre-mRNA-processing factor 39 isoform X2 [Chrysoperla carnea]|uniref:pre-mRNA-processing factor 39 isoform X2 n=1 Tax=Chrysoperla carnea TaxID=189513 RepID=UPI001D07E981|nr:pre-mRNA-processing factor 39 isoform X2 [Chrysoperla carnea]